MKGSSATTIEEYISALPEERRDAVEGMRALILRNLPKGYVESLNWGMISYEVPLERFADTYNGKPLVYLMLAAQKRHNALYMMGVYGDPEQEKILMQGYKAAGKRIDMGKSCLRFKQLDDLPTDVIADLIAATSVEDMIDIHNHVHIK